MLDLEDMDDLQWRCEGDDWEPPNFSTLHEIMQG